MRVPSNPLVLIGPTILLVFAASFVATWARDRQRSYMLFWAAASLLFCLGSCAQIFAVPPDTGLNAVVSAFLYTLSVLLLCDGMLRRSGKGLRRLEYLAGLVLIVGGIAYFFYIDRQLLVRIYILNFGYGLVFLTTAWRLRHLRAGRRSERLFFWVLLLFAVHFFPRTAFTVGVVPPGAPDFGASPFWLALQFSLAVLGVALALTLFGLAVGDTIEDLLRERATDPLTGVLNRRGFEEAAARHFHTPQSRPISLLVVDIDHFKTINDTHGHPTGDRVLTQLGHLLAGTARQIDICGRLGGEEFALLLPNCDLAGARSFAERLRIAVRSTRFDGLPSAWQVTASFGIAEARQDDRLPDLTARADAALYRAKRAGRDRIELGSERGGGTAEAFPRASRPL